MFSSWRKRFPKIFFGFFCLKSISLLSPYQTESFTKGFRLVRTQQGNDKVFHFDEISSTSRIWNFFLKSRFDLWIFLKVAYVSKVYVKIKADA